MSNELSTTVNNAYQTTSPLDNQTIPIFSESSILYSRSKFLRYVTDDFIRACRSKRELIKKFYATLHTMDDLDAKSLLYISNFLVNRSWYNISFDNDDYKNLLIVHLKKWEDPLSRFNQIIDYKIHNLPPEDYLKWFKSDLRSSIFIAYLLSDWLQSDAYVGREELLNGVTDFIRYNIHLFIVSYSKKMPLYSRQINQIGEWKTVDILFVKSMYFKNRLDHENDIDWIDPTNDRQISWIYRYLDSEERQYILLKGVFFPQSLEEKFELILASLDVLSNVESRHIGTKKHKGYSLRGYTLFSMKKAWDGQKSYEAKNEVDEWKVKVYKKNHAKLKALIAFSDFTDNQMINNSIEQMYDQLIKDDTND